MKFIDTHAHLNFTDYAIDNHEIITDSQKTGISIINVGTNFFSSQRAVELAQRYPEGVFAAIGLHPSNIQHGLKAPKLRTDKPEDIIELDFDAAKYGRLIDAKKVVAVGEIGLDNFSLPKSKIRSEAIKAKQKEILLKQLAFARDAGLPVIIHCRDAHDEIIDLLADDFSAHGRLQGVIHCFTATKEQAVKYYDLGFHFGLNGILFKDGFSEAVAGMPLDRILLETDCPFLSPPGAAARNLPQNLPLIAERVAQIRNDSVDTIIDSAANNARKLFGIG